jgi:hypothetical protein
MKAVLYHGSQDVRVDQVPDPRIEAPGRRHRPAEHALIPALLDMWVKSSPRIAGWTQCWIGSPKTWPAR